MSTDPEVVDARRASLVRALTEIGLEAGIACKIAINLPGELAAEAAQAIASHSCPMPESIAQALNSGDGTYKP